MAYNSKNLLYRAIAIQELVMQGQKRGVTQKWVYKNEVYPRFLISYSTFNNIIAMNAKKLLQDRLKLEAEQAEQKRIAAEKRKAALGEQLAIDFG